jgi:hypothetical protein
VIYSTPSDESIHYSSSGGLKLARKTLAIVLTVMIAFAALGCGTSAPMKLAGLPEATQLKQGHEQPLRYRVAFAPISTPERPKPKGQFSAAVNTDATAMRNELAQMLREFKVFSDVETVGGGSEPESMELAKEQGADLLLTSSLVRYDVTYERGVRGAGSVILWLFSPWATWFVADEVYTADIGLQMALKKVPDGSVLWQEMVDGKARCELDDLQRGLKAHEYIVGSIFTGPGSFDGNNFAKVASVVGPHALQKLQLKMLGELYKLPQPPPDKKSFAIVVGLNEVEINFMPKLEYAEADAAAVEKLLSKSFSEVKLLTGDTATTEALRSAVEDFATREFTEVIDFLLYFAGPGASAEGKHLLAFSNSKDAKTMLSLDELHSLASGVKAMNRALILDTGFSGEKSRGAVLGGEEVSAFEKSLRDSSSVATLCCCGPDQGGHEFKELGHGIFTAKLLEALAGPGDMNEDKTVSAEEAVTFIEWPVERYVRDHTVGQSQKPVLLGGKDVAAKAVLRLK